MEKINHFFNAAFSIDLVLFTYHEGQVKLLLLKKEELQDQNKIGLPGQLIFPEDDTLQSINQLSEKVLETSDFYKIQLQAFSDVGRHPEGRVITIAYLGLIPYTALLENEFEAQWFNIKELPQLPYDHNLIAEKAFSELKKELMYSTAVFEMLPQTFVLSEVIDIYEIVFNQKIDAPNFRRQLRTWGYLVPQGMLRATSGLGRKAQEYSFDKEGYNSDLTETKIGFNPIY